MPLSVPGAASSTPTMSTTGGMTIGRIVMPSNRRCTRGSRRCTQIAVGTMSASVITMVTSASDSDSVNASTKPDLAPMPVSAPTPSGPETENSSAA